MIESLVSSFFKSYPSITFITLDIQELISSDSYQDKTFQYQSTTRLSIAVRCSLKWEQFVSCSYRGNTVMLSTCNLHYKQKLHAFIEHFVATRIKLIYNLLQSRRAIFIRSFCCFPFLFLNKSVVLYHCKIQVTSFIKHVSVILFVFISFGIYVKFISSQMSYATVYGFP